MVALSVTGADSFAIIGAGADGGAVTGPATGADGAGAVAVTGAAGSAGTTDAGFPCSAGADSIG